MKRYLYLWYLGMISFSSISVIEQSAHLDIIRIINSCLRDFASIAREKALRKPAIGALIRSSVKPILLNRQRNSLYVTLDRVAKPPNFAQSNKVLLLSLIYQSYMYELFLQSADKFGWLTQQSESFDEYQEAETIDKCFEGFTDAVFEAAKLVFTNW